MYRCNAHKMLSLFILFSMISFSQESKIDSLKGELKSVSNVEKRARLLNEIGLEYIYNKKYFDSAFYYTEKSIVLSEEKGFNKMIGSGYVNLANLYSEMGNYDTAINNYKKAKEIFEANDLIAPLSVVNSSIASMYFLKEDFNQALEYFKHAIVLSHKANDTVGIIIDHFNLADTYHELGDYQEAKMKMEYARTLIADKNLVFADSHLYYGKVLLALNNDSLAEEEVLKGYQIAQKNNSVRSTGDALQLLFKIQEKKENYKDALYYFKQYTDHEQAIQTAKEMNNREKLILNLNLSQKNKELEYISQRDRYKLIIAVLIGLGLILLTVLIFRQFKMSKMTKEMHDIQHRLITSELRDREDKKSNKGMSNFMVTKLQDKSLKK